MSETAPDSLTVRFQELQSERERSWPPEQLRRNIETRQALVAAFDPAATVQVGDVLEPFTLEPSAGGTLSLDDLVADGPVLLIFFRFAGCPACNIALPWYDRAVRPALAAAGVRIVAVSPHLPERGLDAIRERHGLGFTVAADRGNVLGRRFGITFVPADAAPPEPGDDSWIGALTGTGTHELPQPAVVLVDRERIARFVDVSPDWLRRTEAPAIHDAVAALRLREAA